MVLLVAKINKLYSKLENLHHHDDHTQFEAALEEFKSDVSICLNKLSFSSKPGSEIFSFASILQVFEVIPAINKGFAKLVVSIDYPVSKWESSCVDEYLKYSFNLLELFNSVFSSLSHVGLARLSLCHALSLVENSPSLALKHLKAIPPLSLEKEIRKDEGKQGSCSSKEEIVHKAMVILKSVGFWVCGVVLSGLCGDKKHFLEMRKLGGGFSSSSFERLDLSVSEAIMEKNGELKEVKEVNDAVACLVAAISDGKRGDEAEEFRRKLEVFEKPLEDLKSKVEHLFNEVLGERNQLVNGYRMQIKY
ncbi:hypothetical protein UlMin_007411 [Ulmus minor]